MSALAVRLTRNPEFYIPDAPGVLRGATSMADDPRYVLVPDPDRAVGPLAVKPVVFPALAGLARRINRDRKDRSIELEETRLQFGRDGRPRTGVTVWTVEGGARRACLGWAWLGGKGREVLQAALLADQPAIVG